MHQRTEYAIYAVGLALSLAIAPYAFADNLNQSGVGNSAYQNSNNSTIGSHNTSINSGNTSGSNNHLKATGGSAHSNAVGIGSGYSDSASHSSSDNSVSVEAQKRNPVSTAWAAPLVTSDETCAFSTSFGLQVIGTGGSFGNTHEAENCVRLKNSRELERRGYKKASIALLCMNEEVAKAMQAEKNNPCPVEESPAASDGPSVVASDYPERAR